MARVREARRLREEAMEDAERLWQSTLAEIFPSPGQDLPAGWRWVRLGEVASREAVIVRPSDATDEVFDYLGMEQVEPGQWNQRQPARLSGEEIRSQAINFRPGLVLHGKLRPHLNKVVVPSLKGIASTELLSIRPRAHVLSPDLLAGVLRSQRFVRYATSNTTGSRQPRTRLDALWHVPLSPSHPSRNSRASWRTWRRCSSASER
ncbi:MAG: hypothetical protein K6U89_14705 [Chloroflexi bacterium]|nr:hypothetical protein [Chloroflexota bacterium]